MDRLINILEFPSNLGLIEPGPGIEPGVKNLPDWLRHHGFHKIIAPENIYSLNPPAYSMDLDPESKVRNADAIALYAAGQAELLHKTLSSENFALVIGGDCSILIGNALALKKFGNIGLFFLDGHTDFMWPDLSQTHGAAGMDLAIVSGNGHDKLANIQNLKPYFREEDIWAVGNREFDEQYESVILNSDIQYFNLKLLRTVGIASCVNGFLDVMISGKKDGFWIHLDVDILDDNIMPAVDSREPGGLSYEELETILESLLKNKLCVGMEITILDPDLDPDGQYTREFVSRIATLIRFSNGQPV